MFSYAVLVHNPIASICFLAYAMSFLSLWMRKTAWLWGSFLFIAYVLALQAGIAEWISLIPVLILCFCHYFLKRDLAKGPRFLFFCVALGVSLALSFHFLPGFHNWKLVSDLCLSPGAYPYNLWLNFDKPFIGLFALAFSIPLLSSKAEMLRVLKISIPTSIVGILVLIGISLSCHLVAWDPKIPTIFFLWFFDNLIFVSIPEEAFFRGFIQRGIFQWFGSTSMAGAASIFITSILFTLLHLIWVANLPFLSLVFVASMIYGTIYQMTKSIEASILCHFGLNVVHFLFFSYPAL